MKKGFKSFKRERYKLAFSKSLYLHFWLIEIVNQASIKVIIVCGIVYIPKLLDLAFFIHLWRNVISGNNGKISYFEESISGDHNFEVNTYGPNIDNPIVACDSELFSRSESTTKKIAISSSFYKGLLWLISYCFFAVWYFNRFYYHARKKKVYQKT